MSTRTIWKFPLRIDDDISVRMPAGAQVLCVQAQGGEPMLWAVVDPDAPQTLRRFWWRWTGHPMGDADGRPYVGTVQIGALVFHLFRNMS